MARDLPTYADWQRVAGALGLRQRGAELVGPCPSCGGDDRFHASDKRRAGTAALFGCRRCKNASAILKAAFPDRLANGADRNPAPPKRDKPPSDRQHDNGKSQSGEERFADAIYKEEARRWWHNAAPVTDDTPAHAYLATRNVLAAANDPERVRWLARTSWLELTRAGPRLSMPVYPKAKPPAQAVGAILYPYRNYRGRVVAVTVEALTAAGTKVTWPDGQRVRFVVGRMKDAWHRVTPTDSTEHSQRPIAVCEGPLDAWAIAQHTHTEAWAAGSASALPSKADELAAIGREIQLWPDGDPPGRRQAGALLAQMLNKGAKAHLVHIPAGSDPHDQLTRTRF